jgi:hypothetical protein
MQFLRVIAHLLLLSVPIVSSPAPLPSPDDPSLQHADPDGPPKIVLIFLDTFEAARKFVAGLRENDYSYTNFFRGFPLDPANEVLRRIPGVVLNQTREIHR